MAIIQLAHVTKTYPGHTTPAIAEIDFKVEQGEVLSILGPSGCGKTTILRLIAGFERPDQGEISLQGRPVSTGGSWVPPERRGVAMVFQDYALFPHLTAAQNVAFGLRRLSASERRRRVGEILRLMGLSGCEHAYPHELSGGEQQRVAVARALAPNPIVLLLDEPFSHLDPDMRSSMREEVHQVLRRVGMTVIVVTHDHEEAFAMADKLAVLHAGRLEQLDTPEAIYHTPVTPFVADFVGQADFLPGCVEPDGQIHTEVGPFPNERAYPVGTSLVVMIRPDDIHVVPHPQGNGLVVSRQFRGSENRYTIALPSGQILHSSEHSVVVYPVGTRVEITLTATHTVLFQSLSLSGTRVG